MVPKILIIDDSATSCLFMERVLKGQGYRVITANDGREGLIMIMRERPDCLILDVVLPGMNGFEICRLLRTRNMLQSLPVIMVSSKNTPMDKSWALRQGAMQYLVKPFEDELLLEAVHRAVDSYVPPISAFDQNVTRPQKIVNAMPPAYPQNSYTPYTPAPFAIRQQSPVRQPFSDTRHTEEQPSVSPQYNETRKVPAYKPDQTDQFATRTSYSANQPKPSLIQSLVPQRIEGADSLWAHSPHFLFNADKKIRVLYEAIDGHKNVETLCIITHMSMEDVVRALRHLLAQHRIKLCEPTDETASRSSVFFSELPPNS